MAEPSARKWVLLFRRLCFWVRKDLIISLKIPCVKIKGNLFHSCKILYPELNSCFLAAHITPLAYVKWVIKEESEKNYIHICIGSRISEEKATVSHQTVTTCL